ncbi:uncharacterized protein LOC131213749 [Anopheles bellator]|uniref:uncharacterized protein LOC131213749 n=1 Tax=Anopheles bellator TaxID=139047 RepID=UPI002647472F|nr:uncharacterized protein LOC131213749 [Anopheles bellator]
MTLPRLELQAAVLLADLYVRIKDVFGSRVDETHWWSDSQVALTWIRSDNSRWDVFVKNRVAKVQTATATTDWHYVPTKLNPADIVSRGISARRLIRPEVMTFWLNGPSFVQAGCHGMLELSPSTDLAVLGAVAPQAPVLLATVGPDCDDLIAQYPHHCSLGKTRRHFAWLGRAVNNFKAKSALLRAKDPGLSAIHGPMTLAAQEVGLRFILLRMQTTVHPNEVREMQLTGHITPTSRLQHLNPICVNGVIHVQGRLQNAELAEEARLPILVPKSHPFSRVMIRDIHERNHHAGVALVIAEFRTRYWMRDLRRTVAGELSRCVTCVKARPRQFTQQMGSLPVPRVNPSPPFTHTGIDLCGPFVVASGMKGNRNIDVYVCIFVRFATKAVHLEVVEDQSTQAFISGLMRFVSLRGRPNVIYCDNGRNFVGAARELHRLRDVFNDAQFQHHVVELAADEGICFSFIPPRSPNFGGLWEANIKVAKRLLKAASRGARLRLIEMQTFMHQISAILNSRPLTAIRTSPEDVEALTPAHFLIGRSSFNTPATLKDDETEPLHTRWKRVQRMAQHFWTRWRSEYLAHLRCAAKSTRKMPNAEKGQIVLIGDDNLPVSRWPLGVITQVHPGPDGAIRVADVKTGSRVYRRNVRLLAPLPVAANPSSPDDAATCSQAADEPSKKDVNAACDGVADEPPRPGNAATCDAASGEPPATVTADPDDDPPQTGIWDGRLRPKGGRMV